MAGGYDVDLFVVGAGSGGVRAARIAASHGAEVAIAEQSRIGGTCVIRGCVPKKLLVYASRFADEFEDAEGFGWTIEGASFDWPTLVAAKEKEVTRLSGLYEKNLDRHNVAIHRTRAVLEGPHAVRLATGERITAGHILISTGAWPFLPPIHGVEHAITSNEAFDLAELPERLLIIGGGYIAVEFASLFARLGPKVTIAFRAPKLLRGFDEDLRDGVEEVLKHAGVEVLCGTDVAAIDRVGERRLARLTAGEVLEVDQVMIATGRVPNVANLGLEEAGVALDEKGAIVVTPSSQTTVPSIYAVGDVTNRINLTPVAIREGHAFADSVFGGKPWNADHSHVPTAVFTTPEIGTVGISEAAARLLGKPIDVYRTRFRPMKATLSGRDERVMMKIVVDRASDRVLGVHVMGEGAGEMAQLLGIAVKMGATKADFDATMAVHPTSAEELVTLREKLPEPEPAL